MLANPYLRFSHAAQQLGSSIPRQRSLAADMIALRKWFLGEEYVDDGRSASKGRHRVEGAELYRFEQEAAAGLHAGTVLVVENLDRLSRRGHEDTYDLIRSLHRAGVHIATCDDGEFYEAGKPLPMMQVLTILIKSEAAREEVQKKGARVKDAHARRRAKSASTGCALGKLAPYWLAIDRDCYVPIKDRADLVRRIFDMADAGDGALTIAKKLNEEGVPVWQRWEKRPVRAWDRTRIRKILADEAVLGWRKGKGDPIRIYPQIVPSDLFERVRGQAPVRAETRGGAKSALVSNLVSGLATCDKCGSSMEYQRHRREGAIYRTRPAGNLAVLKHESATLMCRAARHRGCSNRAGITYYGFERALLDAALHIALDDTAFVQSDELGRVNRELADKRHALELTRVRAERLWEAWASDDPSDMRRKLAEKAEAETTMLSTEVETLVAARERAAGKASAQEHLSRIEAIRAHLYDRDLEVRRVHRKKVMEGLRSVISHIWCDDQKVATVVFAGGMAALQIKGGKVIKQANAVRMFSGGDFGRLKVPDRMARAVYERIKKTLIANGSMTPDRNVVFQSSRSNSGRAGAAAARF